MFIICTSYCFLSGIKISIQCTADLLRKCSKSWKLGYRIFFKFHFSTNNKTFELICFIKAYFFRWNNVNMYRYVFTRWKLNCPFFQSPKFRKEGRISVSVRSSCFVLPGHSCVTIGCLCLTRRQPVLISRPITSCRRSSALSLRIRPSSLLL